LPPEGFIVKGTEGPLEEGELERAAKWSKLVVKFMTQTTSENCKSSWPHVNALVIWC